MTEQTWEVHKNRHPEVQAHFPSGIKETIERPEGYRNSTHDYAKDDTIAFDKTISGTNDKLRVIVQYEATTFLKGDTTGKVTSIYLPSSGHKTTLGPLIATNTIGKEDKK